jgi:hypothetical protein
MNKPAWLERLLAARRESAQLRAAALTAPPIERAARYLVQKIARENAALHAVHVLEARLARGKPVEWAESSVLGLVQLRRRHQHAVQLRHAATADLRLALGLQEHPSAIEVNGWGEAP